MKAVKKNGMSVGTEVFDTAVINFFAAMCSKLGLEYKEENGLLLVVQAPGKVTAIDTRLYSSLGISDFQLFRSSTVVIERGLQLNATQFLIFFNLNERQAHKRLAKLIEENYDNPEFITLQNHHTKLKFVGAELINNFFNRDQFQNFHLDGAKVTEYSSALALLRIYLRADYSVQDSDNQISDKEEEKNIDLISQLEKYLA